MEKKARKDYQCTNEGSGEYEDHFMLIFRLAQRVKGQKHAERGRKGGSEGEEDGQLKEEKVYKPREK